MFFAALLCPPAKRSSPPALPARPYGRSPRCRTASNSGRILLCFPPRPIMSGVVPKRIYSDIINIAPIGCIFNNILSILLYKCAYFLPRRNEPRHIIRSVGGAGGRQLFRHRFKGRMILYKRCVRKRAVAKYPLHARAADKCRNVRGNYVFGL